MLLRPVAVVPVKSKPKNMDQEQLIELLSELGFKIGEAHWVRYHDGQRGLGWGMSMPEDPLQYSHVHCDTISTAIFSDGECEICVNGDKAHIKLAHLTPNFLYYILVGLDFKTNANY